MTAIEVDPDGGAAALHRDDDGRHDPRAPRRQRRRAPGPNDARGAQLGLQLPIRAEGLHLNVTEPREHVLEPMVQHIGRRLTLKQSDERHVHHRRRLAGAARAGAGALLDDRGRARPATPRSPCA